MTCAGERCDVAIDDRNNVTSDVVDTGDSFEENGNVDLFPLSV